MQVTDWPIDRLRPYENNPREISQISIDKVASSIAEFGFLVPVIAEASGVIVAGHTRVLAANKLGRETVPVIEVSGLTPAQIQAFRILENRSHENSRWDFEKLKLEVDSLLDAGFDLKLTGFEQNELAPLMAEQSTLPEENETPAEAPEDKPVKHSVKFSNDQWEVVLRAIQKVREMESQKDIDDARALELVCADFLAI